MNIETMKVLVVEPEKEPYVKEISSGLSSLQKEVADLLRRYIPLKILLPLSATRKASLRACPSTALCVMRAVMCTTSLPVLS